MALLTLIIMDGYGLSELKTENAIYAANTPNLDRFFKEYPNNRLHCSGLDVGLPKGQMGNSEVGHTNIGAGRIVYQELTRITKSIEDLDFYENEALLESIENCLKEKTSLHIMGLMSDGGVHSHNTHLYAILRLAKEKGLKDVYVHCFLDGRDVPPTSGKMFVSELEEKMRDIGVGKIATVMGRYYAMDRDNRWDRVEKAYSAMCLGVGNFNESAVCAIEESYNNSVNDEFVVPTVITDDNKPISVIKENDSIVFFNFRPDRAREITRVFVDPEFSGFKRDYKKYCFVCMTQYDASMPNVKIAFKPQSLSNTFGEYISKKGLKQLRIAETEKYAHVTFFFNGGVENVYEGEERILVPSPKVATYDLQPEMSACLVRDEVIKVIEDNKYDVIILNFANCDMVGHTGIFDAAKSAVEVVDECVGEITDVILKQKGTVLITADHGNADLMIDPENGEVFTAHTTNDVPFILVSEKFKSGQVAEGCLADIAPTMLDILGLEKPHEMQGRSLII